MREFTCVVCGTKGIDNSGLGNKKYCCMTCANKARYHKRGDIEMDCKFNNGVVCSYQECDSCGWNPKVEKIRKAKLEKEITDG